MTGFNQSESNNGFLLLFLIASFLFFNSFLFSQQMQSKIGTASPDSNKANSDTNPLYELNSIFDRVELTRQLNMLDMSAIIKEDSGDAWLRMRMLVNSGYLNKENETTSQFDILKPLYNNYLDSQKLKTLKYILGMAQVSAVGYLAYLHIKKYGFLKRK